MAATVSVVVKEGGDRTVPAGAREPNMVECQPRLIVGLGNPGSEHESTRHNVGFLVVDRLRQRLRGLSQAEARDDGLLWNAPFSGSQLYLLKPMTYMNASGLAVRRVQSALDLVPEQVLIVCDCIDMDLGRLRLRRQGSSGGHRGLESIITALGSNAFARLRVGIGRTPGQTAVGHVLAAWREEEVPTVMEMIGVAADAVLLAIAAGLSVAMNRYNGYGLPEHRVDAGTG